MARQILLFALFVLFSQGISQTLNERFRKAVKRAENTVDIPSTFLPLPGSENHRNVSTAIFSVGIMANIMPRYYKIFFGTLRKTGYEGDVVVAIHQTTSQANIDLCLKFSPVLYQPLIECHEPGETKSDSRETPCRISGTNDAKLTMSMLRYRMYLWWASKYESHTNIFIADFRDVFFQSNPFTYLPDQWAQPISQLTVFLEASPQKAIYRCKFNSGWIRDCYGEEALNLVKSNPVSCSGTSLGSRDGILLYVSVSSWTVLLPSPLHSSPLSPLSSILPLVCLILFLQSYLMLEQIDETSRARYGVNGVVPPNKKCHVLGMDQGLHNWLLFSGRLRRLMKVKVFSQGEGPVNTLGAFYTGPQAMFQFDLIDDWKILRGPLNDRYVSNWNGDPSPVIHQLDRFE
jgi:hypothetical protein